MSALATPLVTSASDDRVAATRRLGVAVPVAATLLAVAIAGLAKLYGGQPIQGDARGYYDLALGMVQNGPLSFTSGVRTYGYPAFLALLISVVGPDPERVRTAGFVLQLPFFVAVAWIGAHRISRLLGAPHLRAWLYTATVLNPFILIHAGQMLTDVISATLIYLAVALSLPDRPAGPSGSHTRRRTLLYAMLTLLVGGMAVLVRPANLIMVPILLLAWLVRTVVWRDIRWRAWPLLLAVLALPFVPQMVFNARAYGVPHPLLMTDLYAANTSIGMRTAKYATITMTGVPSRLYYANPYAPTASETYGDFLRQEPLKFGATLAIHAFGLFDQDFPFTYITDLTPWYRWPLALINYLFLLGGFVGLFLGLRWPPGADAAARARARFVFGLLGAATAALVVIYLPSAVECRFSLPMYPLLVPPFVLAMQRIGAARRQRPGLLSLAALGAALWVAALASMSVWVEQQAPTLVAARAAIAAPPPPPTASYRVDLPEDWEPGQTVSIPITVTNTGPDEWNPAAVFPVAVRAQFIALKGDQHRLLTNASRVYVSPAGPVAPGASTDVVATLQTPTATGRYTMKITVIRHGIDDETTPSFEKPARVDKGR
jgi:hypothetical protein